MSDGEESASVFTPEQQAWIKNLIEKSSRRRGTLTTGVSGASTTTTTTYYYVGRCTNRWDQDRRRYARCLAWVVS